MGDCFLRVFRQSSSISLGTEINGWLANLFGTNNVRSARTRVSSTQINIQHFTLVVLVHMNFVGLLTSHLGVGNFSPFLESIANVVGEILTSVATFRKKIPCKYFCISLN